MPLSEGDGEPMRANFQPQLSRSPFSSTRVFSTDQLRTARNTSLDMGLAVKNSPPAAFYNFDLELSKVPWYTIADGLT